jgi:hypothetical protein
MNLRLTWLAALLASTSLGATPALAAYTFTKIADSSDGVTFTSNATIAFYDYVALNDMGDVAFAATKNGEYQFFRGNGTSLAGFFGDMARMDADISNMNFHDVNDSGTIFFSANRDDNTHAIYTTSDGTLGVLYEHDTPGQGPTVAHRAAINDAGTPAYLESIGTVYVSRGVNTPVYPPAGGGYSAPFAPPTINASGALALLAQTTGGVEQIIRINPNASITVIAEIGSAFTFLGTDARINDAGEVTFLARDADNTLGIYVGDGTAAATPFVEVGAGFSQLGIGPFSMDGAGRPVFVGLKTGSSSVGIYAGPDPVADRVIEAGTIFAGKSLIYTYLGIEGVNESGQIAFLARFSDGTKAAYRANPIVPSPTATAATPTTTATPTPSATPTSDAVAGRKCRAALAVGAATLVAAEAKALGACHAKIVRGKLPADTVCRAESKAAAAVTKARDRVDKTLAKSCGGKDKTCGVGGDDVPLAEIGWDSASCPSFPGATCTNAVTDCTDIATCLTCIGEAAVDQAIGLAHDALIPTDPKDKAEKPLNKCQAAVGGATTKFFIAKANALVKCWIAVNAGKAAGPCPDAKASAAIAKAEAKKEATICKACGGDDKACDGVDDFTPLDIGFVPTCPAADPPGTTPPCSGAIGALQDLVDCIDCVSGFDADCATLAAVPDLAAYPSECQP